MTDLGLLEEKCAPRYLQVERGFTITFLASRFRALTLQPSAVCSWKLTVNEKE